jgi:hypothetical protein
MDARSFDVLADDLRAHHMLGDDVRYALRIHPIIQSGRTARAREGRKPAPQQWHRFGGEDLSHQDVGSLRASPEATLPHQLRVLLRTVGFQRSLEHVAEACGSPAIAAFRTTTNHDLETTHHGPQSVTGTRRHVNPRARPRHVPHVACLPRFLGMGSCALPIATLLSAVLPVAFEDQPR